MTDNDIVCQGVPQGRKNHCGHCSYMENSFARNMLAVCINFMARCRGYNRVKYLIWNVDIYIKFRDEHDKWQGGFHMWRGNR